MTPAQQKANKRTGLILLTIALAFFVGFVARMHWLGG